MSKPMTRKKARDAWKETWEKPITDIRRIEIDELIVSAIRNGFRTIEIRLAPEEIDGVRFHYTEQGFACSPLRYGGLCITGWTEE